MSSSSVIGSRFALMARYRETFVQAWRERHRNAAFLLTADEAEFSPPAVALTQRPVSPTSRLTAALLIALVAISLAWSVLGRVDVMANALGEVIPSARTKTIASVETAVVRSIYVREGQSVTAGQILVALDAKPLQADYRKATSQERAAELEMARSRALINAIIFDRAPRIAGVPGVSLARLREAQLHLSAQYLDYSARLRELEADIEQFNQALPVARQREQIYARLLQTHDVSRDAWLAKEQEEIDVAGRLANAQNARTAFIAGTRRSAYETLTRAQEAAAAARQEALHAASQAAWLTLRSPVNGVVQQLAVHTVGGVAPASQPLMLVVPSAERVEVQAYLQNKDVGFVKVGQLAQVKVATFDYTRYGTIPGRVVFVSRDAIEASGTREDAGPQTTKDTTAEERTRYLVRVALARSTMDVDGHAEQLLPGMAVTVEIKTGRRRVIDYFLSPLLRQSTESLHER